MKKLFERLLGPLGPAKRLPPGIGPDDQGLRLGYVPTDQRRAQRVFWIAFGVILAINVLFFLTVLVVRVVT